jgi:D-alanyl-D-alanine carboxypeptidase
VSRPPRLILALLLAATLLVALPGQLLATGVHNRPTHSDSAGALRDEPLEPGTTAIIRADGGCLRLRDSPGLSGNRLDCYTEGSLVQLFEGAVIADGFRWQYVAISGQQGWMADEFLEPYAGAPNCSQQSIARPGLSASLPENGISFQLWGGGTVSGVINTALAGGCDPSAIYTVVSGQYIGFLPTAPAFVNQPWFDHFGGEQIPAGTTLILKCGGPASSAVIQAAITRLPVAPIPASTGAAPNLTTATAVPAISSTAAIIVDEASGAVLYDLDSHTAVAPASLTKIATAILAIEGADLDAWVQVNVDSRQMPGSSLMGLLPGDCMQLRDIFYGLMLRSGNDAALAIARYAAGSDAAFVNQMNTLLSRLGLTDSHFANPHGLDQNTQLVSAYDLAMLTRYGMQLDEFATAVQTTSWTARGSRTFWMNNINGFLSRYEGADGVKTGYDEDAGPTFVGSAVRNGHRVFVVLLNSPDRYGEAADLLDWAYENHTWN